MLQIVGDTGCQGLGEGVNRGVGLHRSGDLPSGVWPNPSLQGLQPTLVAFPQGGGGGGLGRDQRRCEHFDSHSKVFQINHGMEIGCYHINTTLWC